MAPLAKEPSASSRGRSEVRPERFTKIYTNWNGERPRLCISASSGGATRPRVVLRGLRTHHRLARGPDRVRKCRSKDITRDGDVLDTWFSSALWPFFHARLASGDGGPEILLSRTCL